MSGQLAIVLLAAGESRRYGSNKLLSLHPCGSHLLSYITEQYQALSPLPLTVVTGKYHTSIVAALAEKEVEIVHNENWHQGMSSSIACGVNAIFASKHSDKIDHVMLAVSDTPEITTASLQALCEAKTRFPEMRIASQCNGVIMAPAIFPRTDFPLLSAITGKGGASQILRNAPQQCIAVDHPQAALDIDYTEDWKRYTVP